MRFCSKRDNPSDEISEEIETALIEFLEIATECGIDLLDTAGAINEEAFSYGDDPTLDALWESCLNSSGTDNGACDELYWNLQAVQNMKRLSLP